MPQNRISLVQTGKPATEVDAGNTGPDAAFAAVGMPGLTMAVTEWVFERRLLRFHTAKRS
ncbi:hypothetical protein [Methanoculleus sp. UBA303]|jgi:hypothetical protein|uniref:hypothetical protein n=1 Tax=Methanoculleus sp. UBA303 TaxID=1915497 RepID=UPI0025E00849|nr:hypothetical protein [Methanoculleus sp. UBA303]